ncbi:MAG: type II toxin-antitoxin system PemK/MazF family toxin [Candidatus Xenobia bacterium]
MAERLVSLGDVVVVRLPTHRPGGHEQERPVVVVAVPGAARFPLLVVVPLTTQIAAWATAHPELYPVLSARAGQLPCRSAVLLDQVRGIDARRVAGYLGSLSVGEYEPIRLGLARLFSL